MNEIIEIVVYAVVGYFVINFLINVFEIFRRVYAEASEDMEEERDVTKYLANKHVAVIKVKMEEMNGWWYGFYETKNGGELFVAQGTTYEEAVENCRVRLQEGTILKDTELVFK